METRIIHLHLNEGDDTKIISTTLTDAQIQDIVNDWYAVDDPDDLEKQVPLLEFLAEHDDIIEIHIDSHSYI